MSRFVENHKEFEADAVSAMRDTPSDTADMVSVARDMLSVAAATAKFFVATLTAARDT